jgi:hypothetical protein
MPDLDQIKQGEQGARDRGGRFAKGRSHPAAEEADGAASASYSASLPATRSSVVARVKRNTASGTRTDM